MKVLGVDSEVNQNWEIYPAGSVVLGWVLRPRHRSEVQHTPGVVLDGEVNRGDV